MPSRDEHKWLSTVNNAFTLFISDLHLNPAQPKIADIFVRFLQTQAKEADALYILGDLFDVWIGDDHSTDFNQHVIDTMASLAKHDTPIYIMHGNRDFLLGKHFTNQCHATMIPDPMVISLYGQPTLLMHGDTLCTADKTYQRVRWLTRLKWLQWLALRLPLQCRKQIAAKARTKSKQYSKKISTAVADVTTEAVSAVFKQSHVTQLIHGHTHRPCIETMTMTAQVVKRIVLSDWHTQGNALKVNHKGELDLIYFD